MQRADFLKIVSMELEIFKSADRRHQLPFVGEEEPWRYRRPSYTPFEALLLVLQNDFVDSLRMERGFMAELVGTLPNHLWPKLDNIRLSYRQRDEKTEIICGFLWNAKGVRRGFCGTRDELANQPSYTRALTTSATYAFARLCSRAKQHGITLPDEFVMTQSEFFALAREN